MDTKTCIKCKIAKELTEFHVRTKNKDGRSNTCRICRSLEAADWRKQYEEKHGEAQGQQYRKTHLEEQAKSKGARVLRNKLLILQEKYRPCMDCKQRFHPVCMDFDHVRGEKVASVCQLVNQGASIEKVQAEIDKCELVCANCHRIRTHAQDRVKPWEDKRRKYDRSTWEVEIPWDFENYPEDIVTALALYSKPLE
jgi:hypothetical protein